MPQLVRLYIVNIVIGFALAVVFTALLIALDIAHLRHLVVASGMTGVLAVVLLLAFNTILFAGVQFAIAVMRLAQPDTRPPGGRAARVTAPFPPQPLAVPVPARRRPPTTGR